MSRDLSHDLSLASGNGFSGCQCLERNQLTQMHSVAKSSQACMFSLHDFPASPNHEAARELFQEQQKATDAAEQTERRTEDVKEELKQLKKASFLARQ